MIYCQMPTDHSNIVLLPLYKATEAKQEINQYIDNKLLLTLEKHTLYFLVMLHEEEIQFLH